MNLCAHSTIALLTSAPGRAALVLLQEKTTNAQLTTKLKETQEALEMTNKAVTQLQKELEIKETMLSNVADELQERMRKAVDVAKTLTRVLGERDDVFCVPLGDSSSPALTIFRK